MRRFAIFTACLALLVAVPSVTSAQSTHESGQPVWEIHLHLQKGFASPLGQKMLTMIEQEKPDKFQDLTKLIEAIGIDPRTEIGEVVVFGNGFEEGDATAIADLGSSTGNLEGWILAAPGYQSEDLDANTLLHSVKIEDKDARAWLALPKNTRTGKYTLVASLNKQRTDEISKRVIAGTSPVPNPLQNDAILSFFVNDLSAVPMDIDADDPGAAIVRIVQQLGLHVGSDPNNLNVALDITANNAGRARQISQLLLGVKAMVQLAPLDEPEAQKLVSILDTMAVEHSEGQNSVHAQLSAPYKVIDELIEMHD